MTASIEDWRHRAACLGRDPEIWFATAPLYVNQVKKAKRVCNTACPVRDECRQWADETDQRYGTWGGQDEDERRLAKRRASNKASRERVAS